MTGKKFATAKLKIKFLRAIWRWCIIFMQQIQKILVILKSG